MATCSFDREYILKDTVENRKLFKQLNSKTKKVARTRKFNPPTEREKKEFVQQLMKSRNW